MAPAGRGTNPAPACNIISTTLPRNLRELIHSVAENRTMKASSVTLSFGRSLHLRRAETQDCDLLWDKMYGDREFMRLLRLDDQPKSKEQLQQRLKKLNEPAQGRGRNLEMLIIHREYGTIGLASLVGYSPKHRRAELQLGLFSSAHRARYGVEAGLLALGLAFNVGQLNKVCAYVYDYNSFAQKVLTSAGFRREGYLEAHIYSEMDHRFVNLCLFGLTVESFRQSKRLSRLSARLVGRDVTQPAQQK